MSDLGDHFRRQIGFLEKSASMFDDGDVDEAVRLAQTLRVLLFDKKGDAADSVLKQTGQKAVVRFIDTSIVGGEVSSDGMLDVRMEIEDEHGNTHFVPSGQDGLVDVEQVGNEPTYVAPLSKRVTNRRLDFGNWWNIKCIDSISGPGTFSRRNLVLTMANTMGGAHVAANGPEPDYQRFEAIGQGGWFTTDPTARVEDLSPPGLRPYRGSAFACSVRQIAYEVLETARSDPALQDWLAAN